MNAKYSLRFKVAAGFSTATIALLLMQAFAVRTLVETQEEKFITQMISDEMAYVIDDYKRNPQLLPPLDSNLNGYVTRSGARLVDLPAGLRNLSFGVHEIIRDGRELHVAIQPYGNARFYRLYDFSGYEQRLREFIGLLLVGAGIFVVMTLCVAFALSGLLVRQISDLTRQVRRLREGGTIAPLPNRYDEAEVVALARAFNDYQQRMEALIEREKEFTLNASHELRTPLTAIKTGCELLAQEPTITGKSKQRVEGIDRAADRMVDVINSLLSLAREGASDHSEAVLIKECVEGSIEPCREALFNKEMTVEVRVSPTASVRTNRDALMLVLTNLIKNAVAYSECDSILIRYEANTLFVEDSGVGIARSEIPRVFDRFYRGGKNGCGGEGLGLGLAIVKRICEHYGWQISLESEEGKGTRVSIELPSRPIECPSTSQNPHISLTES